MSNMKWRKEPPDVVGWWALWRDEDDWVRGQCIIVWRVKQQELPYQLGKPGDLWLRLPEVTDGS